jgi:hypothetical protein
MHCPAVGLPNGDWVEYSDRYTQVEIDAAEEERKANLEWVARRGAVCEIGLVRITRRRVVRIQPRYLFAEQLRILDWSL